MLFFGKQEEPLSHISTVKTRLKDLKYLKQALEQLGLSYSEGSGLKRTRLAAPAELLIHFAESKHALAAVRNKEDCIDFEGDDELLQILHNNGLMQDIMQTYAAAMVKEKLKAQGFLLESQSKDEHQSMHLILRRMS